MPLFLIVAHAPLASALKAVAAHTYAECSGEMVAIDVAPQADPAALEIALRQAIGEREALILTDIFGATPCNTAARVADGVRVRVVAGVSVPMLWRTLCYRDGTLDDLVQMAVAGGVKGVMHVPPERTPQYQSNSLPRHDQDGHHHQQ
jgi:PTS system ascorbate-specific IIA component